MEQCGFRSSSRLMGLIVFGTRPAFSTTSYFQVPPNAVDSTLPNDGGVVALCSLPVSVLPALCEPLNQRMDMSPLAEKEHKQMHLCIRSGLPPQPHEVPNCLLRTHGSSAWLDPPQLHTTGLHLPFTHSHLEPACIAASENIYRGCSLWRDEV